MADDGDTPYFPEEENDPEVLKMRHRVMGPLREILDDPEGDALPVLEDVEYEDDRVRTDVQPSVPMPTTINLFQHPDAHPFVLDLALLRKYGPEWMQWEPETLEGRITLDFNTRNLSQLNFDKLQAVKCLHLVDLFWDSWTVFSPCVQALSGLPADFRVMQALTVPQILIAADIAAKIRADMEYSLEVKTYMEVCHLHDGMTCPIAPLDKIIDPDLSEYDVDCAAVKDQWDAVRASGKAPPSDTVEGEQLRRMLEAHQILEESRKQLQDQLPLLYHA